MNPLSLAYHEFLFRPLFNLLVGITNYLPGHNFGLSIIIVTIFVRLVLLPPSLHQVKHLQQNQAKMGQLKQSLAKIQQQHKNDPSKKAEATMKLYREAGINPASGCLPLLIQLPILIALYRVFLIGLGPETYGFLYSFVAAPQNSQIIFLSLDLTKSSLVLAILAGILQFILMKLSTPASMELPNSSDDTAQIMGSMQKNMAYIFPAMTFFISMQLPAALALYWVVSTIFGILQQYLFKKYFKVTSQTAV